MPSRFPMLHPWPISRYQSGSRPVTRPRFAAPQRQVRCRKDAIASNGIVDRLWDFGHGNPAVAAEDVVPFEKRRPQRATLVVWGFMGGPIAPRDT